MKNHLKSERYIEILDTTLRDGEQTPGVAFTPAEKFEIARALIGRVRVDRLEVGSARVSEGEREAVRHILDWARSRNCIESIEILGFIDNGSSVNWVKETGGKVINLLSKGSEQHCRIQLRKTPARHFEDVTREIMLAKEAGLKVNLYLEDWSNGMRHSFPYVYEFLSALQGLPIERIMLPDTLGILEPGEVTTYLEWIYGAFPDLRIDFHGHNDYGLVCANSLAAVKAGVSGIHTTVNGLGERTGNQPLSPLVVAINDMTGCRTRVAEKELQYISDLVQNLSGKRCAWNAPIIGRDVFTQTCGVHADGDKKGNLYANLQLPERFGRHRDYALGKLSGKASIDQNLDQLGMELDPETRARVLQEVIRLGDRKKSVSPADLPFIIAAVLNRPVKSHFRIRNFKIETNFCKLAKAAIEVEVEGQVIACTASGDGGFDAFVKALRKGLKTLDLTMPRLLNYEVRIPPGGKTDALVEATVTWDLKDRHLVTTGVDSDQVTAAALATEKMLNLVLFEE